MTWSKLFEIHRKIWKGEKEKKEEKNGELLTTEQEENEWKNGEVSLWKINSAVERKGLPSTAAGSQPLDRESGGGVGYTNQCSRHCWP